MRIDCSSEHLLTLIILIFGNVLPLHTVYGSSECPTVIDLNMLGETKTISYSLTSNAIKRWTVNGHGNVIQITMTQLNMGRSRKDDGITRICSGATPVLKVVDKQYPLYPLFTICGNTFAPTESHTDFLNITYQGNSSIASSFSMDVTAVRCGRDHYACPSEVATTKKCIPLTKLCDGVRDCAQGEDEICTNQCGTGGSPSGGTDNSPNNWPWLAYVIAKDRLTCSGSIIGPTLILTAAHCCTSTPKINYSPADIKVYVGDNIKSETSPLRIFSVDPHSFYQYSTDPELMEPFNDLCILQLEQPIQFSSKVGPICLPQNPEPPPGTTCYATGWGRTASDTSARLTEADLTIRTDDNCTAVEYFEGSGGLGKMSSEVMCARTIGKGGCKGDSGGALACRLPNSDQFRWQIVGVMSYGDVCGKSPTYFTKVRRGLSMIANALSSYQYKGWFTDLNIKRYDPSIKYGPEAFRINVPSSLSSLPFFGQLMPMSDSSSTPDPVYDMTDYVSNTSWAVRESCTRDLTGGSLPTTKSAVKELNLGRKSDFDLGNNNGDTAGINSAGREYLSVGVCALILLHFVLS